MKIKEFLTKLGDMFLDQAGGIDEKRVLGIPIIVAAVLYVLFTQDLPVFFAVSGLGTTLLLGAVAGDQGKLNVPTPPSNPSAGLPGS
jgi:hypothetical protein